jgi:hypothetical protein
LVNYLTYQAVRVVIDQLSETDPPRSIWLQHFSAQHSFQRAEEYLQALMQEQQDLGVRIMTVRESLSENISDLLGELTQSGVAEANMHQRRSMFERMTLVTSHGREEDLFEGEDPSHPELRP